MAPRKVVIAVQLAILSVVITILIFYHDLIAERFTNVTKPLHHIGEPPDARVFHILIKNRGPGE